MTSSAFEKRSPRIALVLGAGGPVGHAFHSGVLAALHVGLNWDARDADLVIGTSAGAQVAALLRAGLNGTDLFRRAAGQPLAPDAASIARHYVRPDFGRERRHSRPWFSLRPAAPGYVSTAFRSSGVPHVGKLVSALLPEGIVRLDVQADGLRCLFGMKWPERALWITAVHLDSGDRVVFGAPGAPSADVGTAVACSGAVPGVCAPMSWQGRRYVDGGIDSATHLDLLDGHEFDLVLASSPLSMFRVMRLLFRREARRTARRLPIHIFEPTGEVLKAMGMNPMDLRRAPSVARAAFESTLAELRGPRAHRLLDYFRSRPRYSRT